MFADKIDHVSINELEEIANRWKKSMLSNNSGLIQVRQLSETGIIMGIILPVIVELLRFQKSQYTNNERKNSENKGPGTNADYL